MIIILINICHANTIIHPSDNVKISSINIQSIKTKEYMLHEYIVNNGIDVCVVSETWLKNHVEDKVWLACSILNRDGNKISTANRLYRTGGGLALIYNKLKVENTAQGNLETFELPNGK